MRICRKCLLAELDEDDFVRSLKEYIAEYPADRRVSDEEYTRRLNICRDCERLTDGMCSFCGCYAEIRALKPDAYCPEPCGDKWNKTI